MKGSQKIQVLYKGIMVCTRKKKLFEVFDFFTAQATEFALKAIGQWDLFQMREVLAIWEKANGPIV